VQFSSAWWIVSFLVGTVGFSIFVYGKKQARAPQLLAGILLLAASCVVPSAAWMAVCAVLVIGALFTATRAGL
jgi:hypothetical protein